MMECFLATEPPPMFEAINILGHLTSPLFTPNLSQFLCDFSVCEQAVVTTNKFEKDMAARFGGGSGDVSCTSECSKVVARKMDCVVK